MLALPDDRLLDANDKIRYFQVLSSQLCGLIAFLHREMSIIWLKTMKISARCIHVLPGQVMQQGQEIYQAFVNAGLMQMTDSEIEALTINLWIVLTNWTNFLYMSGHITDSNHLEEEVGLAGIASNGVFGRGLFAW